MLRVSFFLLWYLRYCKSIIIFYFFILFGFFYFICFFNGFLYNICFFFFVTFFLFLSFFVTFFLFLFLLDTLFLFLFLGFFCQITTNFSNLFNIHILALFFFFISIMILIYIIAIIIVNIFFIRETHNIRLNILRNPSGIVELNESFQSRSIISRNPSNRFFLFSFINIEYYLWGLKALYLSG